ncbi:MAG: DUF2244 domain-containing protein [Pseudomonadota bacterium]
MASSGDLARWTLEWSRHSFLPMTAIDLPEDALPLRVASETPFEGTVTFDARLTPHRSLGRGAFKFMVIGLCCLTLVISIGFFSIGAWPVIGFFGLDILLLFLLFKVNYQRARQYERIRLSRRELRIDKVSHHGRKQCFVFQPAWVRLEMKEPVEPDTALYLVSHGQKLRIGYFLSAEERIEFARALNRALNESRGQARA